MKALLSDVTIKFLVLVGLLIAWAWAITGRLPDRPRRKLPLLPAVERSGVDLAKPGVIRA